jgi:hypothetical protein
VSIVAHAVLAGAIGCVLVTGLTTGCARGPALSESAETLKADTRALLTDAAERLGPPGARTQVLADAARRCAEGKTRKEFRGRVPLRGGPDTVVVLDQATDVSLTLIRARGYRLERPPRVEGARRRSFAMTRDIPEVHMIVRLRGGRQPYIEFDAATPCLSPG